MELNAKLLKTCNRELISSESSIIVEITVNDKFEDILTDKYDKIIRKKFKSFSSKGKIYTLKDVHLTVDTRFGNPTATVELDYELIKISDKKLRDPATKLELITASLVSTVNWNEMNNKGLLPDIIDSAIDVANQIITKCELYSKLL